MKKKLLLHSCCAPCTCGVIDQLEEYDITLLFYNPNIDTLEEYNRRLSAYSEMLKRFKDEFGYDIKLIAIPYNPNEFLEKVKGFEGANEGGARCSICIELRLDFASKYAKDFGFDLFASTLSVSPHKNNILINQIGESLSEKYNIEYLPSDFKKNNGFLNSVNRSKKYGIYRQNYCGCEFAKSHLKK